MTRGKKIAIGIGVVAALGVIGYGGYALASEKPKGGGGGTLPAKTTPTTPTPSPDDEQPQPTDYEDLTPEEQALHDWVADPNAQNQVDSTNIHEVAATTPGSDYVDVRPNAQVDINHKEDPTAAQPADFDITDPSTWV